jgi:hypothetical protein
LKPPRSESAIDKIAVGQNAGIVNKITKSSGVPPESAAAFAQTLYLMNPHLYLGRGENPRTGASL